jgi:PAS domain S-box-containing protein
MYYDSSFLDKTQLSQALLEVSFAGIIVYDHKMRYRAWSPVMEQISGMQPADVLGENAFELFPFLKAPDGDGDRMMSSLEGQTITTTNKSYEVVQTGKTGWYDAKYRPLHDDNGKVIGGIGSICDITSLFIENKVKSCLDTTPECSAVDLGEGTAKALGQAIQDRRHSLRLTQEELAARSMLHRTYICEIERGERNVALRNLIRLSRALNLPTWVLLGWAERRR